MKARRGSLRRRLFAALGLGFLALIAGVVLTVLHLVATHLRQDFEAGLQARARSLAVLIEQEDGEVQFDYVARFFPEFERELEPEYFQIWLDDGLPLMRSTRLEGDLLAAAVVTTAPELSNAVLPNERRVRVATLRFEPKGHDSTPMAGAGASDQGLAVEPPIALVLAVGRGEEPLDRLLASVRFSLLLAALVAAGIGGWLLWRVVAAGCRPIEAMAAQVRRLGVDTLDQRVELPDTPRELAPVVDQVNALLQRLGEAMQRERRFAGNVAHELRTPVAELRSLAAVGERWPEDRESTVRFFGDVADVAVRMDNVIGNLLLLARCHGGAEPVVCGSVALRALVDATWRQLLPRAAAAGLHLRVEIDDALTLRSDAGKFAMLCTNLLANAVSHARPGTEVWCRAARNGPRVQLEFANAAPSMRAEDLQRLSEPFWRRDEARTSSEHAGLGLSVVTALAKLLALSVEFDLDADGTFRVRVGGLAGDAVAPPEQAAPAHGTAARGGTVRAFANLPHQGQIP